jgi:hypothetical protein
MAKDGSVYIIPSVSPAKVPGLILFEFVFEFNDDARPETVSKICKTFEERLVCIDVGIDIGGPSFGAGLYASKIGEVEELRRHAAAIRGVKTIQVLVLADSMEAFEWIDETIGERATSPSNA